MAVAIDRQFFNTLPELQCTNPLEAEVAWLIYDLVFDENTSRYVLQKTEIVYTLFSDALTRITMPNVGCIDDFMRRLQEKVDEKLESPPINSVIDTPLG